MVEKIKSAGRWVAVAALAIAGVALGFFGVSWIREQSRKRDWLADGVDRQRRTKAAEDAGVADAAAKAQLEIVAGGPRIADAPRDDTERRRRWLSLRDVDQEQ